MTIGDGTVTTYTFGQDLYDDMLTAIDGAEHQILFESYIWKGDETGERFKQALSEAAGRGVEVYAIYDGFANLVVSPLFKRFGPRLKVLEYPVYNAGWRFFDLRRYGRDHRKILVVDDEVGFVGGYNIGSAYATEWRDTHVRITGPGRLGPEARLRRLLQPEPRDPARRPPLLLETAADWEPRIRVHRNVPRLWMFPIRSMYLEAINRASHNIWMTHAYFIPDPDFVEAIERAARRGVDVRLLLPATSNHVVADWLSRGYYGEMLAAGRPDLPVPGRDGARQDLHHRRPLVHGGHGEHRPPLDDRQLRDQRGVHRRLVRGRRWSGSTRPTCPTASS